MSVNERLEREVQEYENKYRGRELPGFINYKTFETMVKEQVKKLEDPAIRTLRTIGGKTDYMRLFYKALYLDRCPLLPHSDAVRKVFIQLAQASFAGFPNLVKTAKVGILSDRGVCIFFSYFYWNHLFFLCPQYKIEQIRQRNEKEAEELLRIQFKMEMLVYTQDRTYSSSLDESKKEDADKEHRRMKNDSKTFFLVKLNNATLIELMLHLKSYYKVSFYNTKYFGFILVSYKTSPYSSDCKSTSG